MEVIAQKNQTGIIKVIQDKFIECGGKSKMQMLKGDPLDIWVASSGEGILNSGYKNLVCEWYILEAIVKKANELGGIMYRGDSAAQNGAKIGQFPNMRTDGVVDCPATATAAKNQQHFFVGWNVISLPCAETRNTK